jgi:hypothetical protein
MTRTASHNSVLSLGSCISAAVTVLSIRIRGFADSPQEQAGFELAVPP